jgi:hypothetical protein
MHVPFYKLRDLVVNGIGRDIVAYDEDASPSMATCRLLDAITTCAKKNNLFHSGYLLVDENQRHTARGTRGAFASEWIELSCAITNRWPFLDDLNRPTLSFEEEADKLEYNGHKVIWVKNLNRYYRRLYRQRGGWAMPKDTDILFCTDESLTECVVGSY